MERLSALDAEFFDLEDGQVHMHIAGACVFDDPPPRLADVRALVASKLDLIPRYRQRVRRVPLEFGRPIWVDDPHFDLDYHLRNTALPTPGDDAAFCRLMGRIMSQPLDRDRPLWEAWLVEGLEGGRWALVFKVHHCMVDGIAGVELLSMLLDLDVDAEIREPRPLGAAPRAAGSSRCSTRGWTASDVIETTKGIPGSVVHPIAATRTVLATGEGMFRFLARLAPTQPLSIEGSIGPHRVWAHTFASIADVKTIRSAFGGTVNDVVLAAVTGGYRALLMERGDNLERAIVRSLVPVSTRGADSQGDAGQPGHCPALRTSRTGRRPSRASRSRPGADGRPEVVPHP